MLIQNGIKRYAKPAEYCAVRGALFGKEELISQARPTINCAIASCTIDLISKLKRTSAAFAFQRLEAGSADIPILGIKKDVRKAGSRLAFKVPRYPKSWRVRRRPQY